MGRLRWVPGSMSRVHAGVANLPSQWMRTSYVPGGNSGKLKAPCSSVLAVKERPETFSRNSTWAPGIIFPAVSDRVPTQDAAWGCPAKEIGCIQIRVQRTNKLNLNLTSITQQNLGGPEKCQASQKIMLHPVARSRKTDRKSTRLNSSHLGISYA